MIIGNEVEVAGMGEELAHSPGLEEIVAVEDGDVRGCRDFETPVSGRRGPEVGRQAPHHDPLGPGAYLRCSCEGVVGRSIVDHDHLTHLGFAERRGDGALDRIRAVPGCHKNVDDRFPAGMHWLQSV